MNTIEAQVRNIAAKAEKKPRLEVVFPSAAAPALPEEHGGGFTVDVGGERYRATIGLTASNPPYLHGIVTGPHGKTRWTDVLLPLGVQAGARLRFQVVVPRHELRLLLDPVGSGRADSGGSVRIPVTDRSAPPPSGSLADLTSAGVARWADRYWDLCSAREREAEHEIERRIAEARRRGHLEAELFLTLGLWKSARQRKNLASNSAEAVERATRAAFALPPREAITALKRLRGVALRMAVAMLHWMRPPEFPMLDFRVIESIGWPEPRDYESLDFYERFSSEVRRHAHRLQVDLRTLDRALWAMSKAGGRS